MHAVVTLSWGFQRYFFSSEMESIGSMLSKKAVTGFACNAVRIWKFPFRRQRFSNETGKMKTNSNVGVEWFNQWGGVKKPPKM